MHNNKKKLVRSLAAMLLALAMALPLTACQVEIPGMGTININDGASDGDTAKTNGGEPGPTTTLWICCGRSWTSVSRTSASRWPTSAISTAA